jgi:hypothetical protein
VSNTRVPVFVGGKLAARHQEKIEAAGAICLGESIATGLGQISALLRTERLR